MIGIHNIRNATAAVALAFTIGLPEKYIKAWTCLILKVFKEDFLIYLIIIK